MRQCLCFVFICWLFSWSPLASAKEVTIGFGQRSEPFVFHSGDDLGISVEIVQEAFKVVGYEVVPILQFYRRNKEEVRRGRLDGAATIHAADDDLYYSKPCISYDHVAIVRARDNIRLSGVQDLLGHRIVAWQNAHNHLGGDFQRLFDGSSRDAYGHQYFEVADQAAQVRMFWAGRADIIVIDSMIFDYMTSMMAGEFDTNVSLDRRRILKAWTIESIAFRDRELRDQFNIGLARLQGRGGVAKIYSKYRSFGAQRATKSH